MTGSAKAVASMINPFHQISQSLKHKRNRLFSSFRDVRPDMFLQRHAGILDDYFTESFENSMIGPEIELYKNPYAIIALGGYGREEQCIHSDVDILFLFRKEVPKKAEKLIQEIVYPLWDIGLDVGYATRTLNECIRMARKDYEILTPILDARFICGMSILFTELMDALRKKILKKQANAIIGWLVERNRDRHRHFGDSTYLLEPNIKEGIGGLRDYHTMLWIGKIKLNVRQPRDLEYFGHLSHEEYQAIRESLSFIWRVRNLLHHITGRKSDQLYFEHQIKLADAMNFVRTNGQQPVERFLGELHGKMDFTKQQFLMFLREHGNGGKLRLKTRRRGLALQSGLTLSEGTIDFESAEAILRAPELLIILFAESARLKIPVSSEAKRMVSEFGYLMDKPFRTNPEVIDAFERILREPAPTFNVLREMLNTGFLVRFIPEMKGIVNRIQYDEYHIYPVDKHVLKTVQALKSFAEPKQDPTCILCSQIWKGLKNKKLLLWAALLHDIGKGVPERDHAKAGAQLAEKILNGFDYPPKDTETISFLIKEHLLLMKTATRRDIYDEETAIACAKVIKKISRLQMLYLLTVADATSTGPNAWSEWTATLLRDLFLRVLNILKKGELASQSAVNTLEKKRKQVMSAAATPDERQRWEALYRVMSPRYLLYMPAQEILTDIDLYHRVGNNREFVWQITKNEAVDTRTIRVCAKDRPGLFSKIAGTFTLNSLDILDAQIFTWRNNTALDIFTVKPPRDRIFENERWAIAERNLEAALSEDLDLTAALQDKISRYKTLTPKASKRSHRVVVDNTSSSFFTIVEVFTYDFPGLLFSITDALFQAGLDIWVAKISTKIDQVVDVFYVRDVYGQIVDSEKQVERIKTAILKRLPKII